MVARWADIWVCAAAGLLIAGCGGGLPANPEADNPAGDTPVAEDPLDQPAANDDQDASEDDTPVADPVAPADPAQGWRPGTPDPTWVISPTAPEIYLTAAYDRAAQELTVVVGHEWDLKMFVSFTLPAGTELAGCEEQYLEDKDAYLVRGGGTLVFHLVFADGADDYGTARIKVRDKAGWYAFEQVAVARSVYFTDCVYDIAGQELLVNIDAQPNQRCLLELTPPAGLAIGGGDVHERIGAGQISLDVIVDAGRAEEWEVAALVADEQNHTDRQVIELWRLPLGFQDDSLHAYPLNTVAQIGDPVCVVIATGALCHPLQYVSSIGLTVEQGARLVKDSLNPGSPGHDLNCADGIWAGLDPPPEGFLVPDSEMLSGEVVTTADDRQLINLNLTPYWEDLAAAPPVDIAGALLNIKLVFDEPGLYTLGFEDFLTVKRTYYSDIDCADYDWEDITNRHLGVPFKLLVLGDGE